MANADNVSVWTTVPVAVRDQLKAIAEQEERSISYIVRRILTRYLDTINAEQIEELAKALAPPPAAMPAKPSPPKVPPMPRAKASSIARVRVRKRPTTAPKTK